MINLRALKVILSYLIAILLTACGHEGIDKYVSASAQDDLLWQDCAWLTREEFDELDRLRDKIEQLPSANKDDFDRYVRILNLEKKTDADLLKCPKALAGDRQKLIKHFAFLGLSYGRGEFSFIDKPRMASVFEMDYFYFYPKRYFLELGLLEKVIIESKDANERLIKYLLGGLITMQAAMLSKDGNRNLGPIIEKITNDFSIIKYGRTGPFNLVLFNLKEQLFKIVAQFLFADQAFSKALLAINLETKAKIYPMFLKKDFPNWPMDYSEVFAEKRFSQLSATVFGIGTSPSGTTLGTGFFAKRKNQILFMTSGHWAWNKRLYLLQQQNSDPFGSNESKLVWLNDELNVFNFFEQLLSPTLEAIGFTGAELQALLNKLGKNPYSTSYSELAKLLPWIDIALGVPSDALIRQTGIVNNAVAELFALPNSSSTTAISLGFGTTEDLLLGDLKTKRSPGLRRMTHGKLWSVAIDNKFAQTKIFRQILYIPRTLEQIGETNFAPTFSMMMGQRCSGAPFIIDYETKNPQVTGVLQGPIESNGEEIGIRAAHFTKEVLSLIDALIAGPQKLNDIPQGELTNLVRTYVFNDNQYRNTIKNALIKAYGI